MKTGIRTSEYVLMFIAWFIVALALIGNVGYILTSGKVSWTSIALGFFALTGAVTLTQGVRTRWLFDRELARMVEETERNDQHRGHHRS